MSYIVWLDYHTEGWKPSEELETLDACFDWLKDNNYGNPYKITKTVAVQFTEVSTTASERPDTETEGSRNVNKEGENL